MKINFIYLPHPYLTDPIAQLPLGILYLAGVLEQKNVPVSISNLSACKSDQEAIDHLAESEVYGITVTSLELLQANKFAKLIKHKYPKCKVILGGAGTVTPEYVDWTVVDSICQGEGEITIFHMLNDIKTNTLKKCYKGITVPDLDVLPIPSRHLLKSDKFGGHIFANSKTYDKTFSMQYKNRGSVTILSSRGCVFKCAFCAAPNINNKLRFRSPQKVYEEIKYLYDVHKIKTYRFSDEFFTAKPSHVKKVCELIKPLGLTWRVSARVKPLTIETLKLMRQAGCYEISYGVESFDDVVLKGLNKGTTAEDNIKAIKMAKDVGMMVRVLFMIRTPFQRPETIDLNIEYLKKIQYDTIAVTSLCPLPGSDLWNDPDRFGIEILNKNLNDYNFYFFGKTGKNTLKDIIKIKDRSLKEFNEESKRFRKWVEENGKINHG